MKYSTELTHIIFDPLKTWVEKSNGNWNVLIGSGFVFLLVAVIIMYVYKRKLGETDERTSKIELKSLSIILLVVILLDIIFPKDYMWQIFFLFKYSTAFFASGIYLAVQYRKDYM